MVPWDALNTRPLSELCLGTTHGISEAAQFDQYQYVWFINPKIEENNLVRFIGVAKNIGRMMVFYVFLVSVM